MTYDEWISDKLAAADPNNRCADWTSAMVAVFPELTRVRGHVRFVNGARCAHWWCVAPDGSLVDPTLNQFEMPIETYEPWPEGAPEPVGHCYWCGADVFAPRSGACSDECEDDLRAEYDVSRRKLI